MLIPTQNMIANISYVPELGRDSTSGTTMNADRVTEPSITISAPNVAVM